MLKVVPIAGVSKFEQAEDLVGIYKVNLTEEDIKYLDEPYHAKDLAPLLDLIYTDTKICLQYV